MQDVCMRCACYIAFTVDVCSTWSVRTFCTCSVPKLLIVFNYHISKGKCIFFRYPLNLNMSGLHWFRVEWSLPWICALALSICFVYHNVMLVLLCICNFIGIRIVCRLNDAMHQCNVCARGVTLTSGVDFPSVVSVSYSRFRSVVDRVAGFSVLLLRLQT